MLYGNIKNHVPLVISHKGDNEVIGYAYKFGVTENLDDIKYEGFVFNKEGMHKIVVEGYDSVSPEINEITENGKVIDAHLDRIAFTYNPAIDGTGVNAESIVFEKQEDNMTETETSGEVQTENKPVKQEQLKTEIVESTLKAFPDVDKLTEQIEEQNAKIDQQTAIIDKMLDKEYRSVVNDMKTLGVEDPSAIVHGLPTDQKITVLSKLRDTMVKTKPLAIPTESTTSSTPSKEEIGKAQNEVLAELGWTPEQYKKLMES
jgi:hypothetical protein